MSNAPPWAIVCETESFIALEARRFCVDSKTDDISPIDGFTAYLKSVIPLGHPDLMNENDVLGRVLLLGIVSGTEMYFRSLLARIIMICPFARQAAADQSLSLNAVDYYGVNHIGYGLLENTSFAGTGEILKATKKIAGVAWTESDSVYEAIDAFETLSHLRHAAIHARGELGPRNTKALKVDPKARQSLIVRFGELQHAADVSLNAVRAYNRYLFQKIVERWIGQKKFTGDWKRDRSDFGKLLALFSSREDFRSGRRFSAHVYSKLLPTIKTALKPKP